MPIENRLYEEKSPYLSQHADNPVAWQPWDDKAFALARRENKPVFLSSGYSTCHWCHVMEEESFSDQEVAEVLNEKFIPIKVDREEQPDVDSLYMEVCQAITGRGGWPLTVVMTPDKKPFFARTYLPKSQLIQVLKEIGRQWQQNPDSLIERGSRIINSLSDQHKKTQPARILAGEEFQGGEDSPERTKLKKLCDGAVSGLRQSFDEKFGGFGSAPKFPQPHTLLFLLRYHHVTGDENLQKMALKTLDTMAAGGIYDQIGFGFSRYATDRRWIIPHFEKMLYDNALLASAYLEAYQLTEAESYARTAREILTYLERDLLGDRGGFYTAEDADVEGEEGKYYIWEKEEIIDVLGKEKGEKFCSEFDITKSGNFEGKNIPNLLGRGPENIKGRDKIWQEWNEELTRLFQEREKRQRPFKDKKVLTGWNGLALAAFARASRVLEDESYLEIACQNLEFISEHLLYDENKLYARYFQGESAYQGYARDYAFLIRGVIELYRADQNPEYLELARALNDELLAEFWDEEQGGLNQTRADSDDLPLTRKNFQDGALPSANSIAAENWIKLSGLIGDFELTDKAVKILEAVYDQLKKHPQSFTALLTAAAGLTADRRLLYLVTEKEEEKMPGLLEELNRKYLPFTSPMLINDHTREKLAEVNEQAASRQLKEKAGWTAYICEDRTCRPPITDEEELERKLKN